MPNLPQYEAPMAKQGITPSARGVEAAEQAGEGISRAAHELGDTAKMVWDQHEKNQEQEDAVNYANRAANFDMDMEKKWHEWKNQGGNADDFMSKTYAPAAAALSEGYNSRRGTQAAELATASRRSEFGQRVIGEQFVLDGTKAVDAVNAPRDVAANLARLHPENAASYLNGWSHSTVFIGATHDLTPPKVQEILRDGAKVIYKNAAAGWVRQYEANPLNTPAQAAAVREVLQRDEYIKNMDPDDYRDIMNQLDTAAKTHGAMLNDATQAAWPSVVARVQDKGDVDGAAQALVNRVPTLGGSPAEVNNKMVSMQHDLDEAKGFFAATSAVRDAPRDQISDTITGLQAKRAGAAPADLPAIDSAITAIQRFEKTRDAAHTLDPAGQVLGIDPNGQPLTGKPGESAQGGNAGVVAAYQKFLKKPSPENFAAYADVSTAEQRRLYPDDQPHVVTKYMADNLATQLSTVTKDKAGAAQTTAVLQQYAALFGSHWQNAAQEFMHLHALNSVQYAAALLYARPGSLAIAQDLIRASVVKPGGLYNAATGVTEARARIAASTALAPFKRTLMHAVGGADTANAFEDALTVLIQWRGLEQGADVTGEASRYASQMITGDYTMHKSLRIPANQDADEVIAGTRAVVADLPLKGPNMKYHLVVPPTYRGLGRDAARQRFTMDLETHGQWVTNGNESGVTMLDGNGSQVWINKGAVVPKFDTSHAPGLVTPGNLDPWHRPVLHNADGSYSTTLSFSFGTDAGEVLVPRVVNGKLLTEDQAKAHYRKTGENLGVFKTGQDADRYSKALHDAQATMFDKRGVPLGRMAPLEMTWAQIRALGRSKPLLKGEVAPMTPQNLQR